MLILPFIHNIVDNSTLKVNTIKFLIIGSQNLWEEKNSLHIDNDILNPNDIYRKSTPIKFDKILQLCEVNTEKTNIGEFYKWEEVLLDDKETFCWKSYYYFSGNDDISWLNIPETEKIGNYKVKELIRAIVQKK
jgi:hypothetical protein